MSESVEGDEKYLNEEKDEGNLDQPGPSDDEDDFEGYFLEPAGNNVNIAEKIAEANRKLLEENEVEGAEIRKRKVQFREELVNFEPNYYSDDDCTQSAQNSIISEEDLDLKTPQLEDPKLDNPETDFVTQLEEKIPDEIPEEIPEETPGVTKEDIIEEAIERNPKFILVLLPKEQNSSCESIIGEEIPGESKNGAQEEEEEAEPEPEKPMKMKMVRPKSAKKSFEVSKISPNLSCASNMERKSWQSNRNPLVRPKSKAEGKGKKNVCLGEIKVQIKRRALKKINIDDLNLENVAGVGTIKRCGVERPRSCYAGRSNLGSEIRPKTAPMKRTCCVIQTELPQYNGLRSEYGLSAEQLKERKQKAHENRMKKQQDQIKKRQEEVQKRNENEETFQKWLFNKTKKAFKKKSHKPRDTLTRSDVYIQTHASYAANRSVPYSLDYSFSKKVTNKTRETRGKKNKVLVMEKLLGNMTPHFKRSFNIYLGIKS